MKFTLFLISALLICINVNLAPVTDTFKTNFIEQFHIGRLDFDFYSGYLTVDKRISQSSLYYIFAPKDKVQLTDISKQDLIIYINSSPRPDSASSSTAAFFFENGPIRLDPADKLFYNLDHFHKKYDNQNEYIPQNWNKEANVLYLDLYGQGLSYVDSQVKDFPQTTIQIADQVYNALLELKNLSIEINDTKYQFFSNYFNKEKSNKVYLFGESLAGKFVPSIAKYIDLKNKEQGKVQFINLKGIGIFNGLVAPLDQMSELGASSWNLGLIDYQERINIERQIMQMRQTYDAQKFAESKQIFEDIYNELLNLSGGINIYNIFKYTNNIDYIGDYFDKVTEYFQDNLNQFTSNYKFIRYNQYASNAFNKYENFFMQSAVADVEYCINQQMLLFIYQGQDDFISNNAGTMRWAENMKWDGSDNFNNMDFKFVCLQDPKTYGQDLEETEASDSPIVGYGKKINNVQFNLINKAGRFASFDTPARTYQLLKDYLGNTSTTFCAKQNTP